MTQSSLRGPLMVLAASLCFSTSGFLQAIAPEGATPFVVAGCRMLIGFLALLIICLVRREHLNFGHWPWKTVFIYAIGLFLFQVSFFSSTLRVGVAIGTVVSIGVTPIFSGLFSWLYDGQRPSLAWLVATVVAVSGLVLVNSLEGALFKWYDLLLPIFAGACYAVEIGVSKSLTEHHSAPEVMMLITLLVGLALLPFFFVYPIKWIFTPRGIFVAMALGIVTAAMAFSLMTAGMKTTSAPVGATLALGEPLGAAVLGITVLHEAYTIKTLTGIALLLGSILVLVLSETVKNKKDPKITIGALSRN